MTVLWYILGSLVVGLAASLMVASRPAALRPDYRLIWDLEEELGFAHLTMDQRPAPEWSDAPGAVIPLTRSMKNGWYDGYRDALAESQKTLYVDEITLEAQMYAQANGWKNLALTPTDADLVALGAEALSAERARAAMNRRREQSTLSSVDQSLRVSGERGFL